MRTYKLLLNVLFAFIVVLTTTFSPILESHAQTSQDWSTPVNLSSSGSAISPLLVKDITGRLHAIWEDKVDGYKYSQSSDGVSWTPPQTVEFPFDSKSSPPVLLAGVNGVINVFWIDSEGILTYGQTTPLELGDPTRWRLNIRLARAVLNFDVAQDSRGVLRVAYIRNSTILGSPAGIYYLQSNISGGYWSNVTLLYASEYFRSLKKDDSSIHVAASNSSDNQLNDQKVYVTWDLRPQKRVFMAVSDDSGVTWGNAKQMKSPKDTSFSDMPFNLNVAAYGNNVLLLWQVGEQGSPKCVVNSQWSEDGGENWGGTVTVLNGSFACPVNNRLMTESQGYVIAFLIGQENTIMVAWNGQQWSDPQGQAQLPTLQNPVTFDVLSLGCQYDVISNDQLYVIGCDQGQGGDIWFLYRSLEPVKKWFSPSSLWGEPDIISEKSDTPEKISYFTSAIDDIGNVHAVWVRTPVEVSNISYTMIEYAQWDGKQWSTPNPIFALNSKPIQLSMNVDSGKRLLLTWINGDTGDLLFTWANLDNATMSSHWATPKILPLLSQINTSPDIITDSTGRIVIAYAIPMNENRGVYILQSNDKGVTWLPSIRAFDAVSAGWDGVEQPKISLSSDGILHLIFVRSTEHIGQPVGLYYSRSVDGGQTWSDAQLLNDGEIRWDDIVCYGDGTVHILWQAFDGKEFINLSQVSQDSGKTWGKINNITGARDHETRVTVAKGKNSLLHFVQLIDQSDTSPANQQNITLQDWQWDGSSWASDQEKNFTHIGNGFDFSLSADITSKNFLGVFLSATSSKLMDKTSDKIYTFGRFLPDMKSSGDNKFAPVIPTLVPNVNEISSDTITPTATSIPDRNILYNDNAPASPIQRNIIGISVIGFSVVIVFVFLLRKPKAKK